jgi:2,4-dienoyl-CoA reductase-like NADH-dependent reductase (Old Yellow Enzyme family)
MLTIAVGSVGLGGDVIQSPSGVEVEVRVERDVIAPARRISGGEFDVVAVGRSLIADPDWVLKVRRQTYSEIRRLV